MQNDKSSCCSSETEASVSQGTERRSPNVRFHAAIKAKADIADL
jgi:hypothetical protein